MSDTKTHAAVANDRPVAAKEEKHAKSEYTPAEVFHTLSKTLYEKIDTVKTQMEKMQKAEAAGNAELLKGIGSLPSETPSAEQIVDGDANRTRSHRTVFGIMKKGDGAQLPYADGAKAPKPGEEVSAEGSGGDVKKGKLKLSKEALPMQMPKTPTLKPSGVPGAKAGQAPKAPKPPQAPGATPSMHKAEPAELLPSDESPKARHIDHPALNRGRVAIITAENPQFPPLSDAGNEGLANDIRSLGLEFEPIKGKYNKIEDPKENGYLIHNMNPEDAVALGKKYGQESVIHSDGGVNKCIYSNGKNEGGFHIGKGYELFDVEPQLHYSTIMHNGQPVHFSYNINWGELHRSDAQPKAPAPHPHGYEWHDGSTEHHAADAGAVKKEEMSMAKKGGLPKPMSKGSKQKLGKEELDQAKCPKCKKGMTLCKCKM